MTLHPASEQPPSPDRPHDLTVDGPGDLIAAVPAMLGFVPDRSLILICLTRGAVEAVMRHDLVDPDPDTSWPVHPTMVEVMHRFADVCERESIEAAVAVVVGGASSRPDRYHELVDTLDLALWDRDVRLLDAHVVSAIETGEQWESIGGASRGPDAERGTVPDPYASAVAAAHVVRGRQIRPSRDDLGDRLAPAGESERDDLTRACDDVEWSDDRSDADALSDLLTHLVEAAVSGTVTVDAAADVSVSLRRIDVRDVALVLSSTDLAPGADLMWQYLTRTLTGTAVADPATLVAFGAYIRGDGALANVALEIARTADPTHRLAALLDTSLQNGMRPDAVRGLTDASLAIARDLGVPIPRRVYR